MNFSLTKLVLNWLLCFMIVFFFNNSVLAGGSLTIKWGKSQEPDQRQVKNKQKKGDHQPMPRLMVTGLNINTGIIPPKRSIMIPTEVFTFS